MLHIRHCLFMMSRQRLQGHEGFRTATGRFGVGNVAYAEVVSRMYKFHLVTSPC
jgi:hypothetical protein